MSILFQETSLGNMTLANRFVRSATWEGLADDTGAATPKLGEFLARLARGEVGLIITGHAFVSPEGRASPRQLGAHSDDMLPGLTALAKAVHGAADGSAVALQLAHGGAHALSGPTGLEAMGPSDMEADGKPLCRAMTREEIDRVVGDFGRAAARARRAGFDAVQIHAAHGYLVSQFLSPAYNQRQDGYGGDLLGRARLLTEVVAAVRDAVGPDYPVLVKMNCQDFLDNGLSVDEALLVARRLENQGVNAVELSGGTILSGDKIPVRAGNFSDPGDQAWYREAAARFKRERAIPLILVGGVRSLDVAEELVAGNVCDYIAMARPLIREPDLIKRWHEGDRSPSACVSDNLCFRTGMTGQGVYCLREERDRDKGVPD